MGEMGYNRASSKRCPRAAETAGDVSKRVEALTMAKNTPKRKPKSNIEDIGLYVSAALGLLESGEYVQPILLETITVDELLAHSRELGRRSVRKTIRDPQRRRAYLARLKKYRIARGRAKERGDFSVEQWEEVKAEFNQCCAYCGCSAFLQMDHVIPIVQGGKHTRSNIVPACRHCNCTKNGRTPEQAGMPIKRPDDEQN